MKTTAIREFEAIARAMRLSILRMVYRSRGAHIGGSFSSVDILVALYFGVMRIFPRRPNNPNRDRFVLSKGHGIAALYAALAERGFFSKKLLDTYCADGSNLPGHSSRGSVAGVEVSTGSLGHGLSMGAGMALAAKRDGKQYRTFVLLSDGECDEGSTWEAVLFAGQHKLDNLVAIVDYNKWQSFGRTKEVMDLEPFEKKWSDFRWGVKECNGHDFSSLMRAFAKIPFQKGKPSVLIAHTVKGKGWSAIEDTLKSHYLPPTADEYKAAVEEITNS